MAKKGQTFKTYSFELKKKAVEMRLQGIPKAKVAEELGIKDVNRLKVWKEGFAGLVDHRGRKKEYKDLERRLKWWEMENEILKKWFEILVREGKC